MAILTLSVLDVLAVASKMVKPDRQRAPSLLPGEAATHAASNSAVGEHDVHSTETVGVREHVNLDDPAVPDTDVEYDPR